MRNNLLEHWVLWLRWFKRSISMVILQFRYCGCGVCECGNFGNILETKSRASCKSMSVFSCIEEITLAIQTIFGLSDDFIIFFFILYASTNQQWKAPCSPETAIIGCSRPTDAVQSMSSGTTWTDYWLPDTELDSNTMFTEPVSRPSQISSNMRLKEAANRICSLGNEFF